MFLRKNSPLDSYIICSIWKRGRQTNQFLALNRKRCLCCKKSGKLTKLEPLLFDNDIVYSVNDVSHDTTISDNDVIETIEAVETTASVSYYEIKYIYIS